MSKGAPKEKLIIGMPTYGRTFTLADPMYYGIGAKAPRPGAAGKYTRENGFLSYYEVGCKTYSHFNCTHIAASFKRHHSRNRLTLHY